MQMNNPQYICHQLLWPQQEPQTPPHPTSPRDCPRPASGSGPGSYEVTAFALGPGAREILYNPFKS